MTDCRTSERHRIVRRIRQQYHLRPQGAATIYVLHFVDRDGANRGIGHARHYIGFTGRALEQRIATHRAGQGSKLVRAVLGAGRDFVVALAFRIALDRARSVERLLKTRNGGAQICPLCAAAYRVRKAAQTRARRVSRRTSQSASPPAPSE